MNYSEALKFSMSELAKDSKTLFVGQSVRYSGQAMYSTFADVPMHRRIEMPVAEEFQMGVCTGLALGGYVPVSIYTRWDFLILAANQLVNHLDKIPLMSKMQPKVIIRVSVGPTKPLNAGPQHVQDYTWEFRSMLKTIDVVAMKTADEVIDGYRRIRRSSIMVEYMSEYGK